MRANRRTNTAPERLLRSELHRRGLRFRIDTVVLAGDLRVRPDIVLTRARIAVFVDGCYWHGCPTHFQMPKANSEYWQDKIARNSERDQRVDAALVAAAWRVFRFWEHEDPGIAAATVADAWRSSAARPCSYPP